MMAAIVRLLHAVAAAQDKNLVGVVVPIAAVVDGQVVVEEVVSQNQTGSRRNLFVTLKTISDITMTMNMIIQTIIVTQ